MNTHCRFVASTPMGKGGARDLGRSTRLRIGNVDIIVTELKSQLLDDEMLKLHGMPMADYKVIAIKSSQHFRAFFETAAARIVTVDTPGIATFDFSNFDFKSAVRYLHPLVSIPIRPRSKRGVTRYPRVIRRHSPRSRCGRAPW